MTSERIGGIKNVGIFSSTNSRSLTDHVGTGKAWDLNRKIDGLFLFNHGLCDFVNHDSKLLKNNMEYIYRSSSENVILTSSYMVCNMDLTEVVEAHEASGADMTVVYTETDHADTEFLNCYTLDVDKRSGRLKGVGKNIGFGKKANICMEIFIMKKELWYVKGKRSENYQKVRDSTSKRERGCYNKDNE